MLGAVLVEPLPHSSPLPHVRTSPLTRAADTCRPPPNQLAPFRVGNSLKVRTATLQKPSPTCASPFKPHPYAEPSTVVTNVHSALANTPVGASTISPKWTSFGS